MSLRPQPTHWFEAFVPREQTVYALEALAATGQVELESTPVEHPLSDTDALRASLHDAEALRARYRALLPSLPQRPVVITANPDRVAREALARLRRWLARRLRLQRRLERGQRDLHRLCLLRECLDAMGDSEDIASQLARPDAFLCKRLFACPAGHAAPLPPASDGVVRTFAGPRAVFHVVVCMAHSPLVPQLEAAMRDCEALVVPPWLAAEGSRGRAGIDDAIGAQEAANAATQSALNDSPSDAGLVSALHEIDVLRWYLAHSVMLTEDGHRCRVTGWTSAADPGLLQQALARAHVEAAIVFRPQPGVQVPPVVNAGGGLGGPFRLFVDMAGAPGAAEVDPSPLLAVLVPLLFGYMFPDVGHGLLLAAAGWLVSRRHAAARFLVPCGFAAAAFGILFGEVFGSHAVLPALWLRPLDEPFLVLLTPLALGVGIILLGLALSGVEAHWRGELAAWLWLDGAVLTMYLSALAALAWPGALLLTAAGLAWYLVGLGVDCRRHRRGCVGAGVGRLLHNTLELALNTLSFVRVGAFALAHAALTHALIEMASMVDNGMLRGLLLVCGHLAILVVEGLVVFVQTTRLVLFEFFTRFLRADGRLFRPLGLPGEGPTRGTGSLHDRR